MPLISDIFLLIWVLDLFATYPVYKYLGGLWKELYPGKKRNELTVEQIKKVWSLRSFWIVFLTWFILQFSPIFAGIAALY